MIAGLQKGLYLFLLLFISTEILAQDTLQDILLEPVHVINSRSRSDIHRLPSIQGTYIFSGKKNEVIDLTAKDVGLSEKYGRQIFAKIPGAFIYDMDGTGNQVNISTRGLDPHRGWEYNIRKDGVMTNTDIYGYPASHYNMPLEAVEKIEMVRGTGSLQYGAQFGGMLNYVSKKPSEKKIQFESINAIGSYNLASTYNALSGTIGKFSYHVWINRKTLDGYRRNSDSKYDAHNVTFIFRPTKKLLLQAEWTHSEYLIHLAGPQTEAMFAADPRSSTRSRNYYSPDIHVPSFTAEWKPNEQLRIRYSSSGVLGSRNSVMFDKQATIADTIVTATNAYNNRQVDIDSYRSTTNELRFLYSYPFFGKTSTLASGIQYINNNLHRRQLGKGTTQSDYDLTLVAPGWGRDLHLKSQNVAVFVENAWVVAQGFTFTTGMRYESGASVVSGTIKNYPDSLIPNTIVHKFPLFGGSFEYAPNPNIQFYGGISQAYRPVVFKDIIPGSVYETSDTKLKDAYGYNAEIGLRGGWKFLKWDITAFQLQYNNRLGIVVTEKDTSGFLHLFRTNIGNSKTNGVECFVQGFIPLNQDLSLTLFTSTSWMDARYDDATIRAGDLNKDISGNKVESVPSWISRNGLTMKYKAFSLTGLYSYTASSFSDPANTIIPTPSAAVGLVPAYSVLDFNLSIHVSEQVQLKFNVNNALDEHYFTKRPQFYPGPGIWASDGRTISAVFAVKI